MLAASGRDLIGRIYDAPLSPDLWPVLLGEISDHVGGSSAWLSRLDVRTGNGTGLTARIDPAMPVLYTQYYGSINPIAKVEHPGRFMSCWRPEILTDEDRLSKDLLVRSEFYNDFMRPQDIHSTLMIRLAAHGSVTSVINIHRSAQHQQFGTAEIEALRPLHSHLIRAFRLTERLESVTSLNQDLYSSLEKVTEALFILDCDGRLKHVNGTGRRLLEEQRCLKLSSGALRARHDAEDGGLQALIRGAALPDLRGGGSMLLTSEDGERPLQVTSTPLQPERISVFHDGPAVLICAGSVSVEGAGRGVVLAKSFGLSTAEVRVATTLLDGFSVAEAASTLHLSIHTIRAHLARIFSKTGTRSQPDLMRAMMKTVGAN